MGNNNYLKILWIVGFTAFALVSCWATASSFHLLLPSWPYAFCWIITIGFYIVASVGSKMIVDSLNQNVFLENRGWRLFGGILLLLIFWLICSMPTNTHTFFYRSVINDKVTSDISVTRGYLEQIINNSNNEKQAQLKINDLNNRVDQLLGELEAEIKDDANPGNGPKAKEIFRQFAALLDVPKIEPLSYVGTSKQERQKLCDAYRTKIYILRDARADHLRHSIMSPNPTNLQEAKVADKNLALMKKYIDDKTIDLHDAEDVEQVCDKLNQSYNIVKKNRDFVNFSSKEDEAQYTAPNPVSKVKRMLSVFDVWTDFMHGEFAGHGFAFWIIISILVDVAAFFFFDLAFRKTE